VTQPEEDFAALFEASIKTRKFTRGQTIEGRIVALGPEVGFIDVGGKGEATIAIDELKDEEGDIEVNVGDRIQAVVVSTTSGLVLSRKMALGAASVGQLEEAFRAGLPVDGKVTGVVKGGYEVSIARQRAFCPFSQIDITRSPDESAHVGRVYSFRIMEFKEGGRNLIVSRRVLLEAQQAAKADAVRKTIAVDAVVSGKVVSVRDFGAFVDLGAGVQGLLHVSEMSWSRVNAADVARVGDEVTVKVIRIDEEKGQIALSLKPLLADPWMAAAARYAPGQPCRGRIERVASGGAFVELEPGIVAFLPASETGLDRSVDLKRALPVGTEVDLLVLEVDPGARRMRVSRTAVDAAREAAEVREYAERERASESGAFGGSLADKLRSALKR
jgi:small subunit ribosomal protein S1